MAKAVGDKVSASWGNSVRVDFKRKTSTDSITSSTTLANDAHIVFNLGASKTYKVDFYAQADGAAAGDIKIAWAVGGGAAALTFRSCIGPGTATTDVNASATVKISRNSLTSAVAYGVDGTNGSAIYESFLVETTTAGTTGTVTLQWAQNSSNVTATRLTSATYATCVEVESL